MTFGLIICIRAILQYLSIKRGWHMLSASHQERLLFFHSLNWNLNSYIANRVGLSGVQEAEQYVLQMIEEKQIYATINQKDGMVIFLDEPERHCGPEVLKELEEELAVCMELNKQILSMDSEIQVNPQYVRKATGVQDEDQPSKSTYAM